MRNFCQQASISPLQTSPSSQHHWWRHSLPVCRYYLQVTARKGKKIEDISENLRHSRKNWTQNQGHFNKSINIRHSAREMNWILGPNERKWTFLSVHSKDKQARRFGKTCLVLSATFTYIPIFCSVPAAFNRFRYKLKKHETANASVCVCFTWTFILRNSKCVQVQLSLCLTTSTLSKWFWDTKMTK